MLLDSDKYFTKLSPRAIKNTAMFISKTDRELVKKNIQVMNSISNELLNKITKKEDEDDAQNAGIHTIALLLKTPDLGDRVTNMEQYRLQSPKLFNTMPRSAVLDYLSDSDFHSKIENAFKEFQGMCKEYLYGVPYEEPKKAEIIEFPKK